MKKVTKVMCLVLCLLMLLPTVVACAKKDGSYGAQINMYLADEIYSLDPAYAHLDNSASKVISLVFEGLMTIDDDGDLKKALLKDYDYVEDDMLTPDDPSDDTYTMIIDIRESSWNDGELVSANDFVFAWKRLLDPTFDGEAASLLYDIKGAREHKTLMESADNIGLSADKERITITFNHSIDPEEFLRKLASPALVPLRSATVQSYYHWGSASSTLVTNGPFYVRQFTPGVGMQLARNIYYHANSDDDINPTKEVTPYCINIDFELNSEAMLQSYEDGKLFYISELPMDKETRQKYYDKVKITDSFSTHTYLFNTTREPFNDPNFRKALGLAIDRTALVNEVVYAYAATGVIPNGINDLTEKDDFAANNAAKLAAEANMAEAKSLLNKVDSSKYKGKTFTLYVKVDAVSTENKDGTYDISAKEFDLDSVDYVVAKKVVEMWDELGVKFEIKPINAINYKESTSAMVQYRDTQAELLYGIAAGQVREYISDIESKPLEAERMNYDVIAVDYTMLTDDPFYSLAVFARDFSGSMVDDRIYNSEVPYGHATGYFSEAYNALIEEAYAAKIAGDVNTYSAKLHEAEKLLLEDMPIVPVFVYQNYVLVSGELSSVKHDYYGNPVFTKAQLKNWEDYIVSGKGDEDDDKKKK